MRCPFYYVEFTEPCEAVRAHIHGTCSACGEWAIDYRNRWTHVGEPCKPRRLGKWVALHGAVEVRFVAGTPERAAA